MCIPFKWHDNDYTYMYECVYMFNACIIRFRVR